MQLTFRKQRQVVKKLTHAGFGKVILRDFECEGDVYLNAEEYIEDVGNAGDYYEVGSYSYDDLGVNRKVAEVLARCNCYAEWVNCGQLVVVAN